MDVKVHDKIMNHSISENVFEKVTKFDIKKCVFSRGVNIMPPSVLKGLTLILVIVWSKIPSAMASVFGRRSKISGPSASATAKGEKHLLSHLCI